MNIPSYSRTGRVIVIKQISLVSSMQEARLAFKDVKKTSYVALVAALVALHVILRFIPGPWRTMSILMEPLEGIIAGPAGGFVAGLLGSIVGRMAKPDVIFVENLFGVGEAFGALAAGLMFKKKGAYVLVAYVALLAIFLIHPLARVIPLWTLWDIYLALVAVVPGSVVIRRYWENPSNAKMMMLAVAFTAFICVELDALVRVLLLTVCGLYQVYGLTVEALPAIFILGAFQTPIEAAYTVAVAAIVGVPVLSTLRKSRLLRWPLT